MTVRRHDMPFGAQLTADGNVRFRLWAPGATRIELCLEGRGPDGGTGDALLRMGRDEHGWFELTTDRAGPGSRYGFRVDGDLRVPDPAARFQPADVHGPSEVVDPAAYRWRDGAWRGRPWEEAVVYELHVGAFDAPGTYDGVRRRLDYLAELGVTAIELMPLADFPGGRNWGYDGVSLYAPDACYGRPEGLKALIDAAHARGLMVLLDVVYNHFGPEGNYLHAYAPQFFSSSHDTPWGVAINLDGADSYWVRQFFIENALYWLEEYHFDGLRLDAVHALIDASEPHLLTELAARVDETLGADRHVHLVLENDDNAARYLASETGSRGRYEAQWNDDLHHALHTTLTGESGGYYADYADRPVEHLARCLTEGFAYQGERSAYRDGRHRGEPSRHLPPSAFVNFIQNHDQVGNRAFGERIASLCDAQALRAATALLMLAPSPPLLFMGQEWGCEQPFLFFCDFGPDLAARVAAGRRAEFARFPEFRDPARRAEIPDPTDTATFEASVLDWSALKHPSAEAWLQLHRDLLAVRRREILPRLVTLAPGQAACESLGERAFVATWPDDDGGALRLVANLADDPVAAPPGDEGTLVFSTHEAGTGTLPAWSVTWRLIGRGHAA
jgi:maltooligosyltrehalose trehalohydrolase